MNQPVEKSVLSDGYSQVLSTSIVETITQVTRIIQDNPALLISALRIIANQKKASLRRQNYEKEGICVPAVIMLSLTQRCNLTCTGCYMQEQKRSSSEEMSFEQICSLVRQAEELGVSFFVLAGGEPLIRSDDIMTLARQFPSMVFALYTNGTLITPKMVNDMKRLKNIVPIISIEGGEKETDLRRSSGVFASAVHSFSLLLDAGIFFGCSVTVTRNTFPLVVKDAFIRSIIQKGCRLFTYVEYVPVQQGTEEAVLTDLQRKELNRLTDEYSKIYPAIFLGFPGDESRFGGCLSAGRGFVHISPSGDVEPCPAAPFSDVNVTRMTLKEALQSGFLARIRDNHNLLSESQGGCALWKNRIWTESLFKG
jgi:MoaA/NifB/PqqE/SkfB family radical SAM enzyme